MEAVADSDGFKRPDGWSGCAMPWYSCEEVRGCLYTDGGWLLDDGLLPRGFAGRDIVEVVVLH